MVAAENQAGTSADSAEASATPIAPLDRLPAGWTYRDIGKNAVAGSDRYADAGDGTFIVSATGSNIGGKSDGIGFVFTRASADSVLTARVIDRDVRRAGRRARIGIMMRESLEPDARSLGLVIGDFGQREAHFVARTAKGQGSTEVPGNGYSGTWPTWLRLERSGDAFTAYQSDDGARWFKVASSSVPMATQIFAGLAVASDSQNPASLTVDHVSCRPASAPTSEPQRTGD
jgi:hypothetical protein